MKKKDGNAKKKEKEIQKLVEDKTFGQKNKNKSKQTDHLVKAMAGQERGGYEKMKTEIYEEKRKKQALEEEKKLMIDLFAKTVPKASEVVEEGKKICPLFKAGLCTKGKKCKFVHEGQDKPKSDKIDLFTDQRDQIFGNNDTIQNWDKMKLEEAVNYNESKYVNPAKTEKTCKFFLEAVEKKTYGWMWVCPNGYNCVFKHALPHDYVFKNEEKKVEEKTEDTLAEEIDKEREKLDANLPKITEKEFIDWVGERRKRLEKDRNERILEDKKKKGHKIKNEMTGKELFTNQQELFQDDDEAVDEYEREVVEPEENEGEHVKEESELTVDAQVFANEEVPEI